MVIQKNDRSTWLRYLMPMRECICLKDGFAASNRAV
jgi:hypothetical protein